MIQRHHFAPDVLYIDLPQGQVSFHSTKCLDGPDYPKPWDGTSESRDRILAFSDAVMSGETVGDSDPATKSQPT